MACRAWALLGLAMAGAQSDVTSGSTPAGPNAWIDIPVFWINVDTAVRRAAEMRAQLEQVLLPGVVATRVSAVTLQSLHSTVTGGVLFGPAGALRFKSPTTREIEIAVTASHLKAIFLGSKLGTGRDNGFMVLEDDINLLFFPRMREARLDWPTSKLSADGLLRSLPPDWSFAMLMVIASHRVWRQLHEAWEADGHATAIKADRINVNGNNQGCASKLWSTGSYLARGSAAAHVLSIWPAYETKSSSSIPGSNDTTGFLLDISRTCWHDKTPRGRRCIDGRPGSNQSLEPNFVADHCLLHYESNGPAMSYDVAMRMSGMSSDNKQQVFVPLPAAKQIISLSQQTPLRTYVVTPPPVVSRPLRTGDSVHNEHIRVQNKSRSIIIGWWEGGTIPGKNKLH
jgi:hypothetical protein